MSHKEISKTGLIVGGYLRLCQQGNSLIIPSELIKLILKIYQMLFSKFETNWDKIVKKFEQMNLNKNLLLGIYSYGWENPSTIQQRAIMPVIEGYDAIVQAQSSTYKTGTFSIAALQRVDIKKKHCQVLILCPARGLAMATHNIILSLGNYLTGLKVHLSIGGESVRKDINGIQKGCHIVVGTPGRINSMIERGILQVNNLRLFILDEADEALSRGFKQQIYELLQYLPTKTQIALFSATMPVDVLAIAERFTHNSVKILVKRDECTLDGTKQYYVDVEREEYKLATLFDIYEYLDIVQAIIFVNSTRKVQWLCDKMTAVGFTVSCIHGELTSEDRQLVMREFRHGQTRVLISTDLVSKGYSGIDVNTVSVVFNYDLPRHIESYIHRIGRSGRYGRKGTAINFVTDDEENYVKNLEVYYDTHIDELPAEFDI